MEPTRAAGPGYPYDPGFDYLTFKVDPNLDGTLLGTNDASRRLRLQSTQAVRDFVAAGRLPALLGSQQKNKRQLVPLWAVNGLAEQRRASEPQDPRARKPRWRDATAVTVSARRRSSELDTSTKEAARLRGENADLRFAWAAMRESLHLLEQADKDRSAAMQHLRAAEKCQSQAAEKAAQAARLHGDALTVYVMPANSAGASVRRT